MISDQGDTTWAGGGKGEAAGGGWNNGQGEQSDEAKLGLTTRRIKSRLIWVILAPVQ